MVVNAFVPVVWQPKEEVIARASIIGRVTRRSVLEKAQILVTHLLQTHFICILHPLTTVDMEQRLES